MDRRDRSCKATSAAASMAALAAAAAAGEVADAGSVTHVDEKSNPPKLGAVAGASSSVSPTAAVPVSARRVGAATGGVGVAATWAWGPIHGGGGGGGGVGGPSCQAERCEADMTDAKRYHRRHKVCEAHAKAPVVIVAGLRQRFCQQCSRFHELSEFDDVKRSCRRRLAGHNERRRKSAADPHGQGSSSAAGDGCRHADHDGRGPPGNGPPLIR